MMDQNQNQQAQKSTPVVGDPRPRFYAYDSQPVIDIMEAIFVAIDGRSLQDSANALQYVLNLVHAQGQAVAERNTPPSARLPGA